MAKSQGPAEPPPGDQGGQSVPIDGGLTFLLAAGVGYGVKKGYDSRKKKDGFK